MERKELINGGKVKSVYNTTDEDKVIIEFRDDMTAGDGERKEVMNKKGCLNAVISSQISNEVILTDLIQKIPLDIIDEWISTIMQRRRGENLEKYNDIMLKSKFNIDYVICRMKKIYK